MKLNFSQKILLASSITFAVVLSLDIIFTNLLLNKIISINDKVKQLNISSGERERALVLKDSISSSKEEREELVKYFVPAGTAETVKFTKYLEDLAEQSGVTQRKSLGYEAVNEMASSSVISAIRFKFNVTGKWANVLSFIQAVENLPKVAYLNNVSVNVNFEDVPEKSTKSSGKIWSAELDFSVVKLKN